MLVEVINAVPGFAGVAGAEPATATDATRRVTTTENDHACRPIIFLHTHGAELFMMFSGECCLGLVTSCESLGRMRELTPNIGFELLSGLHLHKNHRLLVSRFLVFCASPQERDGLATRRGIWREATQLSDGVKSVMAGRTQAIQPSKMRFSLELLNPERDACIVLARDLPGHRSQTAPAPETDSDLLLASRNCPVSVAPTQKVYHIF
jgi:hypothetical protein